MATRSLRKEVEIHFKFLLDDGFSISTFNEKRDIFQFVILTSPNHQFTVRIEFDRGSYELEIYPLGGSTNPAYSLSQLIAYLRGQEVITKAEPSIERYSRDLERYYNAISDLCDAGRIWDVRERIESVRWW